MKTYWLKITLESDTLFGRGDGVAGLVDSEVQHDEYGLPYLGGKTLKGLLTASSAEIRFALEQQPQLATILSGWDQSAERLFGRPGSQDDDSAALHIGDARLSGDLSGVVAQEVMQKRLSRQDVLDTLTTLRRQTAMDAESGAPLKETLRTVRVILRETPFVACLDFLIDPEGNDLPYLAACVKAFRRAGSDRNRGRGALRAELYECYPFPDSEDELLPEAITEAQFDQFRKAVQP